MKLAKLWKSQQEHRDPCVRQPASGPAKKIGRNDSCPCGSGIKYKKCCGPYKSFIELLVHVIINLNMNFFKKRKQLFYASKVQGPSLMND